MSFIIDAKNTIQAVLIMMHGFGTSALDFEDLANYISKYCPTLEIHVLDAFDELDGPSCRMWFPITEDECIALSGSKEEKKRTLDKWKEKIEHSSEELERYIDKVLACHYSLSTKNIILAGFSQGAMMAMHVGLKNDVGCVIAFSGVLVDNTVVRNGKNTDVLIIHGQKDDVLPIESMMYSCSVLFDSKVNYNMHIEEKMRHSINEKCIEKVIDFVNSYLAKTCRADFK